MPGLAIVLAAWVTQPAPGRTPAEALAARFLEALQGGRVAQAQALLAPSAALRRWGGGTPPLEEIVPSLRGCVGPRLRTLPPRVAGNFGNRPLIVATMVCDAQNRSLTFRLTTDRRGRIDSASVGIDWTPPLRPPGPGPLPVTEQERDAFLAALARGSATAVRAIVGPAVLRIDGNDFAPSSPEALIAALRGCTHFDTGPRGADGDFFFDFVCPGRPRTGVEEEEEPGFAVRLRRHPRGFLAAHFGSYAVQVRPRTRAYAPPPPPPSRPPQR